MRAIIFHGFNLAVVAILTALPIGAQSPIDTPLAARQSTPIPMDQLGAVATKQYQGDGLSVSATPDGAQLRCAFQGLEGTVTRDGLWLSSTADNSAGEPFRVVAVQVGRATPCAPVEDFVFGVSNPLTRPSATLSPSDGERDGVRGPLICAGDVTVDGSIARFIRPGLTEEYSVSVDGVRQDFIVEQRPEGEGELRVELDVTGAKAEPLVNGARPVRYSAGGTAAEQKDLLSHGARLVLDGSGRELAYNRLRAVDATGRELPARMEVASGILPDVEGVHPAARTSPATFPTHNFQDTAESAELEASALRQAGTPAATRLAVVVDDASAVYPVRIDPTFSDADWVSMGGLPGADGIVNAVVVDGAGNLYIGGSFTIAGEVKANRVARWNGTAWSALGSGLEGSDYADVTALAVSGMDLYAGGRFTMAGGIAATNVAKWNGSMWSALGSGVNNYVRALAVSGTNFYVGGDFSMAGGVTVMGIAKWDGSTWSSLGSGLGGVQSPGVYALAVSGTNLFVGGYFTTAGGLPANRIARWNGSAWSALGSGIGSFFGYVKALTVSGTNLIAGGRFDTAGGVAANNIARWDGNSWSALGSGAGSTVYALAVSGTNLYAGGDFTTAGGTTVNWIAKWDGTAWSNVGSGVNNQVYALAVSGTDLYAGGFFYMASGITANRIAKWDGITWSALGSGMGGVQFPSVFAVAASSSNLYVGGYFTTVGGMTVDRIAKWDGSVWSALGSGVNDSVYALAVSGTNLYAGGSFTNAGGVAANRIAKWDGSAWSALGLGMNNYVGALAVSGTNLYAGGLFSTAGGTAATNIAKWDGRTWSALASGVNRTVYALAASGTNLYAGCRVANKVGKECAIKVGMDSEHWAMEQNDGFGFWVWSVAEVVNVSIG
ncbi:MAG: hypothetical protein HY298_14875, partial [Verrucomicrobia bacterium]|nr:hypothetical protein [Verrucomicrobiota bacterium]